MCVDRCQLGTCAAGQVCELDAGACGAPRLGCDSLEPQPSSCLNGQRCTNGLCVDVPTGGCPGRAPGPRWRPTNDAPVIYDWGTATWTPGGYPCELATPDRVRFRVKAYWRDGGFPPSDGAPWWDDEVALGDLLHVSDATGHDVTFFAGLVESLSTTDHTRQAEWTMNLCTTSSTLHTSVGLQFDIGGVGGNEQCLAFDRVRDGGTDGGSDGGTASDAGIVDGGSFDAGSYPTAPGLYSRVTATSMAGTWALTRNVQCDFQGTAWTMAATGANPSDGMALHFPQTLVVGQTYSTDVHVDLYLGPATDHGYYPAGGVGACQVTVDRDLPHPLLRFGCTGLVGAGSATTFDLRDGQLVCP